MRNISQKNIQKIRIPLPPLKEQDMIVKEIDQRFAVMANIGQQFDNNTKRCERLRQSTLQKAFSGELVAPEPGDEPASILLERIRIASETIKPTKKKTSRKRTKAMKKVPRKPIIEVLKAADQKMTPTELLTASGFSNEPDEVEEFYLELKEKINAGEIVEERPNKIDSYLKVA